MKRLIPITLSILLAALGASAAGPPHPPGPGGPGGPPNDRALAEYVGLTANQKEAWAAIRAETRTTVESLHEQERALHERIRDAVEAGDSAAAGTLMLQMRALHAQFETARKSTEAKFAALLTTEQKVKFEAFQAAVEFLRQRGPGGGGPG